VSAILRRWPFAKGHTTIDVRGDFVQVKPYQIVVWVSLTPADQVEWDARAPRLPAILDTGNNSNFSIRAGHLIRWAGLRPEFLGSFRAIRERGRTIPLYAADVWLHRNRPGRREVAADGPPFRLLIDEGIAIYPDGGSNDPRLPLLGLRALADNGLHLTIDGKRRTVSLRTAGWFS
jgi:hypothetical protein